MTTLPARRPLMQVPMNDLRLQYEQLKPEIDQALARVIAECSFVLGPQVEAFERAYAAYCGVGHCIGVSNGTDALKLALLAAHIGEGDEVITTPFTFGATLEAICQVGARPVLADIDPLHFTLDPERVEACISGYTRAILPVHIYGQVAAMEPLWELADKRRLALIEDAAQAQGARYGERKAGSLGDMGCFSFYPGKNLGAYGDAGGITTDDAELAERIRRLRNHGQDAGDKFNYRESGYNHRMDGFQGAVLRVKLPYLDTWNQRRRALAARYAEGLGDVQGLALPRQAGYAHHVYHLFVVRAAERDDLAAYLRQEGVHTAVQYPHPVHLTPAFAFLGYGRGDLPVSERACEEILSLPLFPDMEDAQVDYVVDRIRHYYAA